MKALEKTSYTFDELLTIENQTGEKYELIDSNIYLMSGGTLNHSRISARITSIFVSIIKTSKNNCSAFNSDAKLKVKTSLGNNYYYPDAMVKCGEINGEDLFVEDPFIVVEVLSDSTACTDRVKKLNDYLTIQSLNAYLIVRQDVKEIEVFYMENDEIKMKYYRANEIVNITKDFNFPIEEVYEGIL